MSSARAMRAETLSTAAPTLEDVRGWPATVDVSQAATALGCSKSHLYELIRRGECPVRVLPLGGRQRVVTASLVRLLEGA
ncbi:helix-turn-helix transcriptional regulator [Streptomyces sp. NPDC051677]|uniref:helix-turn-helix transcriptional regulator n=1 Tax=Streptomyces sp. NPDC051677 TaxID=3365669 RepID=UPI0037CE458F